MLNRRLRSRDSSLSRGVEQPAWGQVLGEAGRAQDRTGRCSYTPGSLVPISPFTAPFGGKERVTSSHAILPQSVPATVPRCSLRQEDTAVDALVKHVAAVL